MEEQIKASEMKTLNKTMTAFVLELSKGYVATSDNYKKFTDKVVDYAKFLSTPLSLGMFIPTDEYGNVWVYPPTEEERLWAENDSVDAELSYNNKVKAYQKALSNVLFEGFEKCDRNLSVNCVYNKKLDLHIDADFKFEKTIEDLVKHNLTITENALKNII